MKKPARKRSLKKDIAFTVVWLVILLGSVELALQIHNYYVINADVFPSDNAHLERWERGNPTDWLEQDVRLCWRLRPNAQGGNVSINGLGFRSPEFSPGKPDGVWRIFCMGDSVAMGMGLADSDLYTSELQRLLDDIRPGRFEVINAGVPGYTSYQVLQFLTDPILEYKPDAVSVVVGANDSCPPVYLPDKFAMESPTVFKLNMLLVHSEIYRRLRKALFPLYRKVYYEASTTGEQSQDFGRRVSLDDMAANFKAMDELGKENGFRLVLFTYPTNGRLVPEGDVDWNPTIREFAGQNDIPLVELSGPFSAALDNDKELFLPDGTHPNIEGNRVMARELLDTLIDIGLVEPPAADTGEDLSG